MQKKNEFHSGFVALIGRPNVGKSTLMNHLIKQKIAITSNKPQTTRSRIQTVYTDERGQIIFLDTPGIHKAKNKLGEYMVNVAIGTLSEVDVILWLVEPNDYIGEGEQHVLNVLSQTQVPVILVINKMDTVEKEKLEKTKQAYQGLYPFQSIVTVSALRSRNVDSLASLIFTLLPEGPMYFDEDTVTDQPERQIAAEIVREKALRILDDEIPHGIAVTIEKMKERPEGGLVDIEATIICERESHKGIIIGKQGSMLKRIGTEARKEIEMLFEYRVNLKLWVKVKKDWRDSDVLLKNYGYVERKDEE